jgi:hypothetical protein
MSTNLQEIPLGIIGFRPYKDVAIISTTNPFPTNEFGTESIIQDDNFYNPPSIFIDGILLTYVVSIDRRYVVYDGLTKTVTIKNGTFEAGELVQIFL